VFAHQVVPVGQWGLAHQQTIVATGGFLTHYNPPFVDLFLEVAEPFRGRGFGSYLVQELRRLAQSAGHVPAARCNVTNQASSGALQRGGMRASGRVVRGRVRAKHAASP
jgi:GNAT superfamily N-acetyltransferase